MLIIPTIPPTFSGWISQDGKLKKVTADRESNSSAQDLLVHYIKDHNLFGHKGFVLQEQMTLTPIVELRVTTHVEAKLCDLTPTNE